MRTNGVPMGEKEVQRIADELLSMLEYLGAQDGRNPPGTCENGLELR